jgi:hypothetical protein
MQKDSACTAVRKEPGAMDVVVNISEAPEFWHFKHGGMWRRHKVLNRQN